MLLYNIYPTHVKKSPNTWVIGGLKLQDYLAIFSTEKNCWQNWQKLITIVDPFFTVRSIESTFTDTSIRIDSIVAGSSYLTVDSITVINVSFTCVSREAINTVTGEGIGHLIQTGSTIETRITETFISYATVPSFETRDTGTCVVIHTICSKSRYCRQMISSQSSICVSQFLPVIVRLTSAAVGVNVIITLTICPTRVLCTGIYNKTCVRKKIFDFDILHQTES